MEPDGLSLSSTCQTYLHMILFANLTPARSHACLLLALWLFVVQAIAGCILWFGLLNSMLVASRGSLDACLLTLATCAATIVVLSGSVCCFSTQDVAKRTDLEAQMPKANEQTHFWKQMELVAQGKDTQMRLAPSSLPDRWLVLSAELWVLSRKYMSLVYVFATILILLSLATILLTWKVGAATWYGWIPRISILLLTIFWALCGCILFAAWVQSLALQTRSAQPLSSLPPPTPTPSIPSTPPAPSSQSDAESVPREEGVIQKGIVRVTKVPSSASTTTASSYHRV